MQKLALVEDDATVRSTLVELINQSDGFRCAGAYATGEEALMQVPGLGVEIVLMDIGLPRMSGIECVARLKRIHPSIRVLMLTVFEDSEQIFQALRAGADGYLIKRDTPEKLLEAIQELSEGGSPISSQIARKVIAHFHNLGPRTSEADKLSPREREILDLLVYGHYYKEIADKLQITPETVKTYIHRIYEKLHVRTRSQAVAKFLKDG